MPDVTDNKSPVSPVQSVLNTSQSDLRKAGGKIKPILSPLVIHDNDDRKVLFSEPVSIVTNSKSASTEEPFTSPKSTGYGKWSFFKSSESSPVTKDPSKASTESILPLHTNIMKDGQPIKSNDVLEFLSRTCIDLSLVNPKLSDGGENLRKIEDIKDEFLARLNDIQQFETLTFVQKSLTEVHRCCILLSSKAEKYQKSKLFSQEKSRTKLYNLSRNLFEAWQGLMINITISIAEKNKVSSNEAEYSSTAKISKSASETYQLSETDKLLWHATKYYLGIGCSKNIKTAFEKFSLISKTGNSDASYILGTMYESGTGTPKDLQKAYECYLEASKLNHREALNRVGRFYEEGLVVEQNLEKSFLYYKKSAELDDPEGITNLAYMYEKGRGVEKDIELSMKWFLKASESHNIPRAQNSLGAIYFNGIGGIKKNYSEAFKLFQKAADQGNPHAQNNIGICYEEGLDVPRNVTKAKEYYKLASQSIHASAMNNYGYLILLEKKFDEALLLFIAASASGSAEASFNIGTMYESGVLHPQGYSDDFLAFKYYMKSAESSFVKGQLKVVEMLLNGTGTEENPAKAFHWALKCAEENHDSSAYLKAAQMLQLGLGVEKNLEKAKILLKKAAELGNSLAVEQLNSLK